MIRKREKIEVPSPGDRESRFVATEMLGTIIEPRMEELFTLVKRELDNNNYSGLIGAGAVLTGGASLLRGSAEMAEQILDMPVKVGYPRGFSGLTDIIENPSYATVLGLILYEDQATGDFDMSDGRGKRGGSIVDGLKRWFQDFM
jgi:cell division protein FtsA